MNIPTEAWIAINTIALLGIALVTAFTNYRQGKIEKQVTQVKAIVDGPLSVALKSNAELSARLASMTGEQVDILAAAKAFSVNENREAGKSETLKSDVVKLDMAKEAVKETVEAAVKAEEIVHSVPDPQPRK